MLNPELQLTMSIDVSDALSEFVIMSSNLKPNEVAGVPSKTSSGSSDTQVPGISVLVNSWLFSCEDWRNIRFGRDE